MITSYRFCVLHTCVRRIRHAVCDPLDASHRCRVDPHADAVFQRTHAPREYGVHRNVEAPLIRIDNEEPLPIEYVSSGHGDRAAYGRRTWSTPPSFRGSALSLRAIAISR